MNTKSYRQILDAMKYRAIAAISGVSDFNEGSIIMTIFEAIARPLEQAYIDTRNGYNNNLRAIPYSIFGFEQKKGQKASVQVVFTRNEALETASTIPVGTRVSGNGLVFITSEPGTIEAGETQSDPINASAEDIGSQYNLTEDTIDTIESSLTAEIVSVDNPTSATGGTDAETSTQMLRRFKYYINGLQGSNKYGIMAGVLGVEGVRSVSVQEHFSSLKDGIYNFTVYVDDGTGLLSSDLKNQIEDLINGTDTEDNPGLRAAGINCDVSAATIVNIDIEFTAKIYRVETARVQNEIQTKLQEYINGLGINENVVLSSIIVLLKQIPGITDITGLTVNGSTDNIVISVNQIARFRSVDATIINQ